MMSANSCMLYVKKEKPDQPFLVPGPFRYRSYSRDLKDFRHSTSEQRSGTASSTSFLNLENLNSFPDSKTYTFRKVKKREKRVQFDESLNIIMVRGPTSTMRLISWAKILSLRTLFCRPTV